MKPVKLIVQAFGPYAGEQSFDFAELKGRSFFLIHGPTGAGKTSILDAMCFALYGQTSGALRSPRQMRSDHADLATATKVVFEFTIGPDRFRIERSPEQERPRLRGEGTTTQEQKATFWPKVDAEPAPAPVTGWGKVNEAIERLMGFQVDQFRQVVMLPQGQFQRLLTAKSDERQQILENLFDVGLFGRIEEALRDDAKALHRQIEDIRRSQQETLRGHDALQLEDLVQKRDGADAELKRAGADAAPLRAAKAEANEKLSAARQSAEKLAELDAARRAVRELEAQREVMAAKEQAHALGVRAAALAEVESLLQQRRKEAAETTRRLGAARAALEKAGVAKQKADAVLSAEVDREPKREAARQEVDQLVALEVKVLQLSEARARFRTAADVLGQRTLDRDSADAALKRARQQIALAEENARQLETLASQLAGFQSAAREAEAAQKLRAKLDDSRRQLTSAEGVAQARAAKAAKFEQQVATAREVLKELENVWHRGQAAILAGTLTAGSPCPVCGATDHPHPATSEGILPSEATLSAQRQSLEAMEASLVELRDAAAEAAKELAEVRVAVRGYEEALGERIAIDPDVLAQAWKKAQADLARSEQAGIEVSIAQRRLTELRAQEKLGASRFAEAEAVFTKATGELEAMRAIVSEREAGVPEPLRDKAALTQALSAGRRRVTALADAFDAARAGAVEAGEALAKAQATFTAAEESATATRQVAEAQEKRFAAKVTDAGFEDDAAFQAAKLPQPRLEAMEGEIRQYRIDLQSARQRAERAATAAEGLVAPDLASLQTAAQSADAALEANVRQEEMLRQRLTLLDAAVARVRELDETLKLLDARYLVIGQIAETAGGKNNYRVTFQRYVLGVFLDEVLLSASHRLKIMSQGRFLLQRARGTVDGRTSGGLDLQVHDEWTGTTRPVATLSGGESFLASLALALGLADTVQAHAGGIRLETIFIDEGFGSLDPEALDLAIRALQDLQKGGRLVGIISHVTELKEWIDAKLVVTPERKGSVARFEVA